MTGGTDQNRTTTTDGPLGAGSDDDMLKAYAVALADEVEAALPGWVSAAVARRIGDRVDPGDPDFAARVTDAGRAAVDDVGRRVRELLNLDIDEQWTNPLTLIRGAVRYPTEVLRAAGVPESHRDDQARRFHPDDLYDLIPGNFAELGPSVHDVGISWGAAKAHVHLRRRREEEVA